MRADALGFFWRDEPPAPKEKKEKIKRTAPPRIWEQEDYLPGLEEARACNIPFMDADELVAAARNKEHIIFDIECYPGYFLIAFVSYETGKYIAIQSRDEETCTPSQLKVLDFILGNCILVGFNSRNYDIPLLSMYRAGWPLSELKRASDAIIIYNENARDICRRQKVVIPKCNHIDIMEVAPLRASLKTYSGRVHVPRMQDLPFNPAKYLNPDQRTIVFWYCVNDLCSTAFLFRELREQLALRATLSDEYGIDLRSKSDAQIAEAVISHEITKLRGGRRPQRMQAEIGSAYKYNVPSGMQFQTENLQYTLEFIRNLWFFVGNSGAVEEPVELKNFSVPVGNGIYRMGIGGLHSSEECAMHVADEEYALQEVDVTSYYPFIILNLGLYPQNLGPDFLRVYSKIVQRRLMAKKTGDKSTADSLKITVNGSFGKLGSPYSVLYSPNLLFQVTITGQLYLLMLIEALYLQGFAVLSANTDGIVIRYKRTHAAMVKRIISEWEALTGFDTEQNQLEAIFSRDVNNYYAIKSPTEKKPVKTIKAKGAFARPGLSKNPVGEICLDAIESFLLENKPIEETITTCRDIRRFALVRNVRGGAVKIHSYKPPEHSTKEELVLKSGYFEVEGGHWRHESYVGELSSVPLDDAYENSIRMYPGEHIEYLGKVARWYYAKGVDTPIVYAETGNFVPKTVGAKPMMQLPESFPEDIDFERYIVNTNSMLASIGLPIEVAAEES